MKNIKRWMVLLAAAGPAVAAPSADVPRWRVLANETSANAVLHNGGFEQQEGGQAAHWRRAAQGYELAPGAGRAGSTALLCDNPAGEGWMGASQTAALNRARPAPLRVRGWSKAENVSGASDSGYSLYVDLVYDDGTPLWGQTGNFHAGTHEWEMREFVILPDRPVRSLTLHCLFRGRAGRVWFDDVTVEELDVLDGGLRFQGAVIGRPQASPRPLSGPIQRHAIEDGLRLALDARGAASVRIGGRELAVSRSGGFMARDVAAGSDFIGFDQGECGQLGLHLETDVMARSNHLAIAGCIADLRGTDRAVTLVWVLPVDAAGWHWGDDIRRSRVIDGAGEFLNQVAVRCGATGTMSLYPLAALWDDRSGLALGMDMACPAVARLGYHAGTGHLFIAYDFGLAPDTERFPRSAEFRFVLFRFDPAWGFRSAFQRFMEIFPDHFQVRAREQGIWMPFTDVSTVREWEDFGFKFHEGNNSVPWDDAHGVLSFRYTEPMTWWMRMGPEAPRTFPEAVRIRAGLEAGPDSQARRMARAARVAAMHDETGQPALLFRDEPWCNGAVWSLNPNPHLPGEINAATVHWSSEIRERLYGPAARGRLDGEYLDSLEGYVTADLNYRRDHFRATTVPLAFATGSNRLALFKGLAVFEFTRWIAEDVHRQGGLMFANSVPHRFAFLCPWLDVMGTETDWMRGGRYQPPPDATLALWRTMSGAKPYLLLMNTDYDRFQGEWVERYLQRALFYGLFPSMFSHNASENPYWKNPRWYDRDRPLFRKYIPLVKRVAEAGWEPVTAARCDNPRLWIERFGPAAGGAAYLTLFNDTSEIQTGTILLESGLSRPGSDWTARELCADRDLARSGAGWQIALDPQCAGVVRLDPAQ
ncbi:MAG TPA: hypothetical protein P5555_12030 [Candidatus Paceibacterota bacterium]|nr:hypothetical protein [Verrucomicrobiota bacterium]HRZ45909.1 hypothetical protein [Candidatus Paceibacterota bacterium]HRZ91474.1 hypothetical protein [Candidatus Paceibacterota bacterium]